MPNNVPVTVLGEIANRHAGPRDIAGIGVDGPDCVNQRAVIGIYLDQGRGCCLAGEGRPPKCPELSNPRPLMPVFVVGLPIVE